MSFLKFVDENNEFCFGTVVMLCVTAMVLANIARMHFA